VSVGNKREVLLIVSGGEIALNRLDNIDVEKVSLVGKPAIRRRFLLFKNANEVGDMQDQYLKDLDDILLRLEKSDGDEKDKILKELGDLVTDIKDAVADDTTQIEEAVVKAVVDKMEAVTKADEISVEDLSDLTAVLGDVLKKIKETTAVEENEVEQNVIENAGLTEDVRDKVLEIVKSESARITKAAEEEKGRLLVKLQKAEDEQAAQRERIEKMENDARRREWIIKTEKEFGHIPGKPDDLAEMLMKFESADKEEAAKLVELLKSIDGQIEQSKYFDEIGTSARIEGSPEAKIEALAKEKVEKSGGKLDMIQAKAQAWKENPELRSEMRDGG